jgi:hypothetical protein
MEAVIRSAFVLRGLSSRLSKYVAVVRDLPANFGLRFLEPARGALGFLARFVDLRGF